LARLSRQVRTGLRVQTERKKATIQKAKLAQARLPFVVTALQTRLREPMFVTLLQEE